MPRPPSSVGAGRDAPSLAAYQVVLTDQPGQPGPVAQQAGPLPVAPSAPTSPAEGNIAPSRGGEDDFNFENPAPLQQNIPNILLVPTAQPQLAVPSGLAEKKGKQCKLPHQHHHNTTPRAFLLSADPRATRPCPPPIFRESSSPRASRKFRLP